MQAGDGQGCPVKSAHNDVGIGLGLSAAFCNGGNRDDCSSSGNWVGDTRVFVWARWRRLIVKSYERSTKSYKML